MKTALCFAMLLIPTIALVGTVKGTKLWAGECTAAPELRTGAPVEEPSSTSIPDAAGGATPKDQQ